MQIKVRVRTNDVNENNRTNQLVHNGFILYDNCTEVKYGESVFASKEQFKIITCQYETIKEMRSKAYGHYYPETGDPIHNVAYMVRDINATENRIAKDPKFKEKIRIEDRDKLTTIEIQTDRYYITPYHYNTIEWLDRFTNKRHRLIFDTVIFLMDDQGNNLRKIEG